MFRDHHLKPTTEELAKKLRDSEGLSTLEEARKQLRKGAWHKESADWLNRNVLRLITKENHHYQKPLHMIEDGTQDPHNPLCENRPFLPNLSFGEKFSWDSNRTLPPKFGDQDDPLLSGKSKHEEVKVKLEKVKQNGGEEPPFPTSNFIFWPEVQEEWFNEPVREVGFFQEDLMTDAWNSFPEDCPLFYDGNYQKFWDTWGEFHPHALAICNKEGNIDRSIIIHDQEMKNKYGWYPINEKKEAGFKAHEEYLRVCKADYLKAYNDDVYLIRRNIENHEERPTIQSPIVDAALTLYYTWKELHGMVTQKDIRTYLCNHGPDRFKHPKYQDPQNWRDAMGLASRWVPIAKAFYRGKQKPKPTDQDAVILQDGTPHNVGGV